MSAFSQLVDIKFADGTSYPANVSGDIILMPFWHFWGPVAGKTPLNQTEFMQTYLESFPPVQTLADRENIRKFLPSLRNYVECKRTFAAGATSVINARVVAKSNQTVFDKIHKLVGEVDEAEVELGEFRFPGFPTCADLGLDDSRFYQINCTIEIDKNTDTAVYTLYARDLGTENDVVIETFEGSMDPSNMNSAENPYIGKQIEESSILLKSLDFSGINDSMFGSESEGILEIEITALNTFSIAETVSVATDVATTYTADMLEEWKDVQITDFSLFLYPSYETTVMKLFGSIASERKSCNSIIGYPVTETYTESAISSYYDTIKNLPEPTFFTFFIHGREEVTAFNTTYILDGKSAWAGRIVTTATSVRLNQMPSAWTYGGVNAVINKTLTFSEVLRLHEKGINSLFLSTSGPCFFGIKAIYSRQTSYFAKANVSRVTARIIRGFIPEVMRIIHTEVVSDPVERAKFQTAMNGILSEQIAEGNIKPGSVVYVGDDINTDKMTKGGEILNVLATIYFKKLAERVKIKIVATDSSVDVSVS